MSDPAKSTCCTCGKTWRTGTNGSHSCSEQLLKRKMYSFEYGHDNTYTVIATSEQDAIDKVVDHIKEEHRKRVESRAPIVMNNDGSVSEPYNIQHFEGKTPETCPFECTVFEFGQVYQGEIC